jgi:hypothetical protein
VPVKRSEPDDAFHTVRAAACHRARDRARPDAGAQLRRRHARRRPPRARSEGAHRRSVRRRLASEDWFERRYVIGDREVTLFVGRSYDPKSLYHHPELALAYGHDLESRGVITVGGMPVHALVTRTGEPRIVLYALEENGDFVNDPIPFQIRSTLTGLVRGRSAMTLFFALEGGRPESDDLSTTVAARLLTAAVAAFKTAQ